MPADLDVDDPFDPQKNVEAGARYLKQLLDKYKADVAQALGAYNAGPAAVDQARGVPKIKKTWEYVDAIPRKAKNPEARYFSGPPTQLINMAGGLQSDLMASSGMMATS